MIAELYDALIAAGSPEEKARKAAEAMADYEANDQRLGRVEADIGEMRRTVTDLDRRIAAVEHDTFLLKWMMGFVLAFQVATLLKLFIH